MCRAKLAVLPRRCGAAACLREREPPQWHTCEHASQRECVETKYTPAGVSEVRLVPPCKRSRHSPATAKAVSQRSGVVTAN